MNNKKKLITYVVIPVPADALALLKLQTIDSNKYLDQYKKYCQLFATIFFLKSKWLAAQWAVGWQLRFIRKKCDTSEVHRALFYYCDMTLSQKF